MNVKRLFFHPLYGNTYLLSIGDKAVLIDPGYPDPKVFESALEAEKTELIGIFVTHGHYDHFSALASWNITAKIPLFFPKKDALCLADSSLNVSRLFLGHDVLLLDLHPHWVEEGEIECGPFRFEVIETPFHTRGSVCYFYKSGPWLFSGDTLFQGSIGRSDLPGGCPEDISSSLARLAKLPKETRVFPSHGSETTIGAELEANPFFS